MERGNALRDLEIILLSIIIIELNPFIDQRNGEGEGMLEVNARFTRLH